MEVLDHREDLEVRVVLVSFATPARLAQYRGEHALDGDVLLLSDPDREAYAAFGFERAGAARVWLAPRVWRRYAELIARGRRPRPPEDDTLQLGGDVLVGPDGRIAWVHRSGGPADRPSLQELQAARSRV